MTNQIEQATRQLIALGFTEIEGEAYTFLVRESPATGYRVAQGIGRTAANSYKALESLEARGAVMCEEGDPRHYRAVPPDELLRVLTQQFELHCDKAARHLARMKSAPTDDRVYQLRTPAQVYERCRAMLETAQYVVLLDLFAGPLAALSDAISATVTRGVRVALLVYEPTVVEGAEIVLNHQAATVRERWGGQWVNLAVDSAQQLHALLAPDGSAVVHATWSASPFLAHLYQSALLGELTASALRHALAGGATKAEITQRLAVMDALQHDQTPAFAALTERPLRAGRPRGGSAVRPADHASARNG